MYETILAQVIEVENKRMTAMLTDITKRIATIKEGLATLATDSGKPYVADAWKSQQECLASMVALSMESDQRLVDRFAELVGELPELLAAQDGLADGVLPPWRITMTEAAIIAGKDGVKAGLDFYVNNKDKWGEVPWKDVPILGIAGRDELTPFMMTRLEQERPTVAMIRRLTSDTVPVVGYVFTLHGRGPGSRVVELGRSPVVAFYTETKEWISNVELAEKFGLAE